MAEIPSDADWDDLLDAIEDREVVPVVGPALLEFPARESWDRPRPLKEVIAQSLAEAHQIEVGSNAPRLSEVISQIRRKRPNREDRLQREVGDAIRKAGADLVQAPPEAVRQLAAIDSFPLYVSLTADSVLAGALEKQGRAVQEIVHARGQSTATHVDLPKDWEERDETPLLYLFGKADPKLPFAVHEEDRLEYAHDLITRSGNAPIRCLDELRSKHLLVIGADLSDWLYRFFLRLSSGDRLGNPKRLSREWISEDLVPSEQLRTFLIDYSSRSHAIEFERPQQFVAELDRRWRERHPDTVLRTVPEPHRPRNPIFFVSYSRQADLENAQRLVEALGEITGDAEKHIWFDSQDIAIGDPIWHRIREGIGNCAYFLPVLSEEADGIDESYFRKEWAEANERRKAIATQRPFILPIVVDEGFDASHYRHLPDGWPENLYGYAPGGKPSGELKANLVQLVRRLRRGLPAEDVAA